MATYGEKNPLYKHGQTGTKLYFMWKNMHARCRAKSSPSYRYYGGSGISVCKEWGDFKNFFEWARCSGYVEGLSIDRIDSKGNYEPSNCHWVTLKEQQSNKSNNRLIEYRGKIYTLAQLSRAVGIKREAIAERLNRGWSVEDAVNKPLATNERWKYPKERKRINMGISIKEASLLMDCSPQWTRVLCQRNEIGSVYPSIEEWMKKKPPKRMTYHIVPGQLAEFMRISEEELERRLEEVRNGVHLLHR